MTIHLSPLTLEETLRYQQARIEALQKALRAETKRANRLGDMLAKAEEDQKLELY